MKTKTIRKSETKVINPSGDIIEGQIIETYFNSDSKVELQLQKSLTGEELAKVEYKYENDKLVRLEEYVNDEIKVIRDIVFDNLGNKLKEEIIDDKGQILKRISYSETEIIEEQFEDGVIDFVNRKILDSSGQIIKELDGEDGIAINTYQDGKIVNCKMYEDDELVVSEDYEYNDSGNESRSEGTDLETGEKIVVVKEYDEFQNLIKEEQFINDLNSFEKLLSYDERQRVVKSVKKDYWNKEEEHTITTYTDHL